MYVEGCYGISAFKTLMVHLLQEMEYEYDEAMEEQYRANLFKTFNKTLSDGYFPVIIIDAINHKVVACKTTPVTVGFIVL